MANSASMATMAASDDHSHDGTLTDTGTRGSWRRWSHPRQKLLLLLALGAAVGTFMPWLETVVGTYRGFAGPGEELFYLSFLALGAGLVPVRWLATAQAALFAAGTMFFPLWQVQHMYSLVRFDGWFPGVGMIMIFGSGLIAAYIAYSFVADEA
jgi:hypothetical protein